MTLVARRVNKDARRLDGIASRAELIAAFRRRQHWIAETFGVDMHKAREVTLMEPRFRSLADIGVFAQSGRRARAGGAVGHDAAAARASQDMAEQRIGAQLRLASRMRPAG